MNDAFAGLPTVTPGPALAAVLEPGERVHWQGGPVHGGSSDVIGWSVSLALILAGAAAGAGLLAAGPGAALAATAAGILFGFLKWRDRPARWTYALTDRRLLSLRAGVIQEQTGSDTLEGLRLSPNAGGTADVLWRDASNTRMKSRHRRRTGFLRQREGEALVELIRTWRSAFAARSETAASAFTASASASGAASGTIRIVNRDLGFQLDAPSGWKASVRRRTDGPLTVLGVTLLPRLIREGESAPWTGQPDGWNALTLRGAQAIGFDLFARPAPLALTLQQVLDDPWAKALGVETVETDPVNQIGPWRGFAVTRTLTQGGNLTGFGVVPVPVVTRQVWLGSDTLSFEIQGFAPANAPEIEAAMRKTVASLLPAS